MSSKATLQERLEWHGWTVMPSGCWEFNGFKNQDGYGRFRGPNSKLIMAHRAAYEVWVGAEVQPGYEVCHTCDNPPCINPNDLWIGTHADNLRDMNIKGRLNTSGTTKLSIEDVAFIREQHSNKTYSRKELASMFHVTGTTITQIVNYTRR